LTGDSIHRYGYRQGMSVDVQSTTFLGCE